MSFYFFVDLAQRQVARFIKTVLRLGDNKVGVVDGKSSVECGKENRYFGTVVISVVEEVAGSDVLAYLISCCCEGCSSHEGSCCKGPCRGDGSNEPCSCVLQFDVISGCAVCRWREVRYAIDIGCAIESGSEPEDLRPSTSFQDFITETTVEDVATAIADKGVSNESAGESVCTIIVGDDQSIAGESEIHIGRYGDNIFDFWCKLLPTEKFFGTNWLMSAAELLDVLSPPVSVILAGEMRSSAASLWWAWFLMLD